MFSVLISGYNNAPEQFENASGQNLFVVSVRNGRFLCAVSGSGMRLLLCAILLSFVE